ncbi:zinc finger protein 664-like [Protopterus annectens]|uniref:zinc finger protein 664-like n=1 Tax=Protopterus annectens TaxID=7888 RepID=UPI001CF980CE|nr:zinc finger protein 664-like [Protopterus annectens]
MKLEVPETFEDVTVEFSAEEWKMLNEQQKQLHREVMVQNYEHMVAVGYDIPVEQLLLLIDRGEEDLSSVMEGGEALQENMFRNATVLVNVNASCSETQVQQSSLVNRRNFDSDEALSNSMLITKCDLVQTETRHHKCVEYDNRFSQTSELEVHLKACGAEQQCEQLNCRNNFTFYGSHIHSTISQSAIMQNTLALDIFTADKIYNCSTYDDDDFAHKDHLAVPEIIQPAEKPYKCVTCDKCFTQKRSLARHLISHTIQKPYRCTTCDRSFTRKDHLVLHQNSHTGQRPFKCDTCDSRFMDKRSLVVHQIIHTGQKPYKCVVCEKCYTHKSSLAMHQIIHTEQKPYKCALCDKCYTRKQSLVLHQTIHTGEKPHKCPTCEKAFARKKSLAMHQYIHSGQKPYKCTTCNKGFIEKRNLAIHCILHTGQKPFKCSTCDKGFSGKRSLEKHEIIHSGEKIYKCNLCEMSFARKGNLRVHRNIHSDTLGKLKKPKQC